MKRIVFLVALTGLASALAGCGGADPKASEEAELSATSSALTPIVMPPGPYPILATWNAHWTEKGIATSSKDIAACFDALYSLRTDGSIWMSTTFGTSGSWQQIGFKQNLVDLACFGRLYGLGSDHKIFRLERSGSSYAGGVTSFTVIGVAGAAKHLEASSGRSSRLVALNTDNSLWVAAEMTVLSPDGSRWLQPGENGSFKQVGTLTGAKAFASGMNYDGNVSRYFAINAEGAVVFNNGGSLNNSNGLNTGWTKVTSVPPGLNPVTVAGRGQHPDEIFVLDAASKVWNVKFGELKCNDDADNDRDGRVDYFDDDCLKTVADNWCANLVDGSYCMDRFANHATLDEADGGLVVCKNKAFSSADWASGGAVGCFHGSNGHDDYVYHLH